MKEEGFGDMGYFLKRRPDGQNFIDFLFAACILLEVGAMVKKVHMKTPSQTVLLSRSSVGGNISLEDAISKRRSWRSYSDSPLSSSDISQLLWAAQGITDKQRGLRAAPSAGALYPLELYVVAGYVDGLEPGIYKYDQQKHGIAKIEDGDYRGELSKMALSQEWVEKAPASLVICAVYERVTRKYGQRGEQYVHMEVGAVAENVYLQATSLDIGTVFVGAFRDEDVQKVLRAPRNEKPLCIMPLGKKA